jgi:hypothetical protein
MSKGMDSGAMKMAAVFLLVAAAGFYGVKKGYIPKLWDKQPTVSPIYDTDPKNDGYIKSSMTYEQMALLDHILNEEYRNGGQRIAGDRVRQLARGDKLVIQAYGRWRKCRDLMRSSNHIIYPIERGE